MKTSLKVRLANRISVKKWKHKNRKKVLEAKKRYRKRHPEMRRLAGRRNRLKYREKDRAHQAVRGRVRRGTIKKPKTCEGCRKSFPRHKLHGHHKDYLKPLEVNWLCCKCHLKEHGVVFP